MGEQDCERPSRLGCPLCGEVRVVRCKRSSRAQCQPCSERYRRRVRRVFASGYIDRPAERVFMLTLTAPGDRQHTLPNGKVCPCTPAGGVNLAEWNGGVGRRWSDFVTYLRRWIGDVQYCKAAECQQRGAVHFHALLRCDRDLTGRVRALRALAIHHGFGHEIDVQPVRDMRAAGYCSKYASKSVDDRQQCPWKDPETGALGTAMRIRTWTASRRWGVTMAALRQQQQAWATGGSPAGAAPAPAPAGALDPYSESSTSEGDLGSPVVVPHLSEMLS